MLHEPSRRTILAGLAALPLAAGLASCKSLPESSPARTSGQPRRGGHLTAAFVGMGPTETLNPHLDSQWVDGARGKALFDKLVELDSSLRVTPVLATGWRSNAALTVWTLTLREATFHDGRPVTSADVMDTLSTILGEPRSVGRAALAGLDLTASRARGPREIELHLRAPDAELMSKLAAYGTQIFPKGRFDPARPIGSGPFRFVSFTPGQRTQLRRFDGYWDGAPLLDELEIVTSNEESARLNALRGGQVQYIHDVAPTSARLLEGNPATQLVRLPGSQYRSFAMKCDQAPFTSPEVRAAFKHLMDRQALITTVLQGHGSVGADTFCAPGQHLAPGDLQPLPHDPDRARALLKRAGAENLRVRLDVSAATAGMRESAIAFAAQAAKAGVTVDVHELPGDGYWSRVKKEGAFVGYGGGAMTLGQHLGSRVVSTGKNDYSRWHDAQVDAWYAQAQREPDESRRAELYSRCLHRHSAEGGHLVWGVGDYLVARSARLHGVDEKAPTNSHGWARFDKVWLES